MLLCNFSIFSNFSTSSVSCKFITCTGEIRGIIKFSNWLNELICKCTFMGTSIDMVFIEGGARQRERDRKKEIARERERERME